MRGVRQSKPPAYLPTPSAIRGAVGTLAKAASRLHLAVAFVGQDWRDAIADFSGPLRLICWLSSTNTDPQAVQQMMRRPRTEVRQRDSMHAKVYLAPDVGAIVGSANLSRRALSELEGAGRDEAGVLVSDPLTLGDVESWFRRLWKAEGTHRITRADLARALAAFKRAREVERKIGKREGNRSGYKRKRIVANLARKRRAQLVRLARQVLGVDLPREFPVHQILARTPPNRLSRSHLERIVDEFEEWMGRRFLFERAFLSRPISQVRAALEVLFDESRDVEVRMEAVIRSRRLSPLSVSTLSVLLYWRRPEKYPPFNWRTKRLLGDYGLTENAVSNASPRTYGRWLMKAEKHSQELRLPTPGHFDRLVWLYTENMRRAGH
jgi:hypothetical protein